MRDSWYPPSPTIARASHRRMGLQEVCGKTCCSVPLDWLQINIFVQSPRTSVSDCPLQTTNLPTSTRGWIFNLQPHRKEAGKSLSKKKKESSLLIEILCGKKHWFSLFELLRPTQTETNDPLPCCENWWEKKRQNKEREKAYLTIQEEILTKDLIPSAFYCSFKSL